MVNRIWQYHFGKGLVATPSDFGHRGGAALASRAARLAGHRVRRQRLVHEEAAQADHDVERLPPGSEVSKDAVDRDADNLYLSHFNRRRLLPEEIRDGMLQSSGVLNLKMGGRPVVPEVAREELYGLSGNGMWVPTAEPGRAHAAQHLHAGRGAPSVPPCSRASTLPTAF